MNPPFPNIYGHIDIGAIAGWNRTTTFGLFARRVPAPYGRAEYG